MDAHLGKLIRLGRLVRPESGRAVIVAASHGVMSGPPAGLRTRAEIDSVFGQLRAADGVMVTPGMSRLTSDTFIGRDRPGSVLHLDWKNVGRSVYTPGKDGRSEGVLAQLANLEEVAAAGFDAVMTYLYIGQKDSTLERAEIERNARIVQDAQKVGVGVIIEPRSALEGSDPESHSNKVMTTYCRIAADVGADLVKVVWPGDIETWSEITDTCFAPVLLAGGPGGDDVESTFRIARETVDAGGAGVMFGRRVFRSPEPERVLAGLNAIVHEDASVEDVLTRN